MLKIAYFCLTVGKWHRFKSKKKPGEIRENKSGSATRIRTRLALFQRLFMYNAKAKFIEGVHKISMHYVKKLLCGQEKCSKAIDNKSLIFCRFSLNSFK